MHRTEMTTAERFILRNGQRKLHNLRCPICDKLMLGPLSRYINGVSVDGHRKRTVHMTCPACHQPFEIAASKIKYEA